MRATNMYGSGDARVDNLPDPKIIEPIDAIICISSFYQENYDD